MRVNKAVLATGVAAIASLCSASPASALKVKYVEAVNVVPANSINSNDAQCPPGFKVTGGGAFSNGAFEETKLQASYPVDGEDANSKQDDAWRAVVWNTGAAAGNIESLAICAKVELKYRSEPFSLGVSAPPRVKCGKDLMPTGGGIDTGGTFPLPVDLLSSRPSDGQDEDTKPEAWFANAHPPGMATPFAETYAICVKPSQLKPKYRTDSFSVDDQDQNDGSALCKPGERVIGLGGATNASSSALIAIFGVDGGDDDLKLDDGATVRIDNYNLTLDISPETFAVCAK